jgi:hypothetical protein
VLRSTIGARVMTGDAGAIERCRAGGSSAWGSQGRLKVLIASVGIPRTAAAQIVANLARVRQGLRPEHEVEPARGY